MKLEDKKICDMIQQNDLGNVKFFRYSLTINTNQKQEEKWLLAEMFQLLHESGQQTIKQLTASHAKDERATLLTLEFEDHVMANLFIGYASDVTTYTKVLEVVGDKALYQFNSDSPTAFSTTFTKESYAVDQTIDLSRYETWFNMMTQSIQQKTSVKEMTE